MFYFSYSFVLFSKGLDSFGFLLMCERKTNLKNTFILGCFSIRRIIIEQIKIENKTTEKVMYFISLPEGIPNCSGTEAKTAAANPLGIINPIVLLSKTFAPFGAQYFAIIMRLINNPIVIKPPIKIDFESENGMLIPI